MDPLHNFIMDPWGHLLGAPGSDGPVAYGSSWTSYEIHCGKNGFEHGTRGKLHHTQTPALTTRLSRPSSRETL